MPKGRPNILVIWGDDIGAGDADQPDRPVAGWQVRG